MTEVVAMPGRRLEFIERTEIRRRLSAGESLRMVGVALARPTSTVSREVGRNGGPMHYHPLVAQLRAHQLARRPKTFRFEKHPKLARLVEAKLWAEWSPDQIAGWLRQEFPDDPRWWVSAQTIYESIYVQGRGGLRDELRTHLRRERTRARRDRQARHSMQDMVMIAERPPEVDGRHVPGHWEGDLLVGPGKHSQIATLVERTTRYVMLLSLPEGKSAAQVRDALVVAVRRLPDHLRRSLTWDQGKEMARHVEFTIATGVQVYFCDPGSPWQRGTAENTHGLLRQYFPKGEFDFRSMTQDDLDGVAHRLNARPRKTLRYNTPAHAYADLVAMTG
jgi:transposase, IS30 family